nr:hypothetical protein Iba_chr01aCG6410 [Ipomoea batatas]GME17714.1 hypothetical protein Iba_scaffold19348CG0020 [Ipomoea batatas]
MGKGCVKLNIDGAAAGNPGDFGAWSLYLFLSCVLAFAARPPLAYAHTLFRLRLRLVTLSPRKFSLSRGSCYLPSSVPPKPYWVCIADDLVVFRIFGSKQTYFNTTI